MHIKLRTRAYVDQWVTFLMQLVKLDAKRENITSQKCVTETWNLVLHVKLDDQILWFKI